MPCNSALIVAYLILLYSIQNSFPLFHTGLLGQGGLNINTANVVRINGLNGISAVHSASSTTPTIQPGKGFFVGFFFFFFFFFFFVS